MINWSVVALALFAGLLLVILLEAALRSSPSSWRWFIALCGVGYLLTGGWLLFTLASDEVVADRPSVVIEKDIGEETAVPPLPSPSIFTFTTTIVKPSATPTAPAAQPVLLAIPDLKIKQTIVDVSLQDGMWNVAELGENVGLLAGTGQHPGDELAMVLVGHMTFPSSQNLLQGAFANLQYAVYGTEVIVQTNGEKVHYKVVEIKRVDPNDVEQLRVYDGDSILLVTCTDWDENGRIYAHRLLIRAERVDSEF